MLFKDRSILGIVGRIWVVGKGERVIGQGVGVGGIADLIRGKRKKGKKGERLGTSMWIRGEELNGYSAVALRGGRQVVCIENTENVDRLSCVYKA